MDDDNSSDGSKNTGGSGKNTLVFPIKPSQNNFFCPNCNKSISKLETAANHSLYKKSLRKTMNDRCKPAGNEKKNFDGMIPVISYENKDVKFSCTICDNLEKQGQDEMFKKVKKRQRQRNGTQKSTYNLKGLWTHMKSHHQEQLINSGVVKKKEVNIDNTEGNGDANDQTGGNKTIKTHNGTERDNDAVRQQIMLNQKFKCTRRKCEKEYCQSGILKSLKVCPECALKHFQRNLDKVKFDLDDSRLPKAGDNLYGLFNDVKRKNLYEWYPGKVNDVTNNEGMITIEVAWEDGDTISIHHKEKGWSLEWFVYNK